MAVGVLRYQGVYSPWSPDFGARQYCRAIAGYGGHRGPDLTLVADRLSGQQITLPVRNGAYNIPAFAGSLKLDDLSAIAAFFDTRKLPGSEERTEQMKTCNNPIP